MRHADHVARMDINSYKILSVIPNGTDHMGDIRADERVILTCVYKTSDCGLDSNV